jgi:regulator of protease activity HflC (stomatin/prohibitin superfamily)
VFQEGVATVLTLAVLAGLAFATVRVVQPQQAYVVTLLGRYRRTLGPGVHLLVPVLERVYAKVPLGEQVVRVPAQPAITVDDLVLCAGTTVYYQVRDPARLSYAVADLAAMVRELTTTSLRTVAASITLEQARTGSAELAGRLTEVSRENGQPLGIDVIRAEIDTLREGSRPGGCP